MTLVFDCETSVCHLLLQTKFCYTLGLSGSCLLSYAYLMFVDCCLRISIFSMQQNGACLKHFNWVIFYHGIIFWLTLTLVIVIVVKQSQVWLLKIICKVSIWSYSSSITGRSVRFLYGVTIHDQIKIDSKN